MKIGVIGRSEILFDTILKLNSYGHEICFIITAKEAPEYTKNIQDFKNLALKMNIPFETSPNIEKYEKLIKKTNPEIGVSVNYTKIIPQKIIDLFPLGVLNAHGGDLPKYRGNACQAWAILNGEKKIGLCIHKMIGGELDSGDIIAKKYMKIDDNIKITKVLNWITKETKHLYLEVINNLEINPYFILEKQSTNEQDALRCYPRQPIDGKILWSDSSLNIHRLVNASNKPYSGAFCYFEEKKLIIWDSECIHKKTPICAIPGQITYINENYIDIACGTGELRCHLIEYNKRVLKPNLLIKTIRARLT